MTVKKRKVAVFDIDGTIFRSSLLIELVEALILEKIFPKSAKNIYIKEHKHWIYRKDSYEKYITAVVSAFTKHIRGVNEKDFLKVVRKVINFHKDRVYCYTRDLVKSLKNKNYYLLAISQSPLYIVKRFSKQIGFDKAYGIILSLDKNNRFTGDIEHKNLIMNKSKILNRAVEKENLTLKDSIGVGDTESDIPFLKLVDRPICFNPNKKLYKYAKRKNWKIIVERKNVIYTIK